MKKCKKIFFDKIIERIKKISCVTYIDKLFLIEFFRNIYILLIIIQNHLFIIDYSESSIYYWLFRIIYTLLIIIQNHLFIIDYSESSIHYWLIIQNHLYIIDYSESSKYWWFVNKITNIHIMNSWTLWWRKVWVTLPIGTFKKFGPNKKMKKNITITTRRPFNFDTL